MYAVDVFIDSKKALLDQTLTQQQRKQYHGNIMYALDRKRMFSFKIPRSEKPSGQTPVSP